MSTDPTRAGLEVRATVPGECSLMAEPPPADPPYVFISYARQDEDYVIDLLSHHADHGIETWFDTETDYGTSWPRVIRDRVDGCAAMIVVMTSRSEDSEWVSREILRAEREGKTILPLLLDGSPFFELATTQHEDVSDGRMPASGFVQRLVQLTSTEPPISVDDPTIAAEGQAAVTVWNDEAERLSNTGPFAEALVAADRAIDLDPDNPDGHLRRGSILMDLRRNDEAIAAYDRAIDLDPSSAHDHARRSGALIDAGRTEEALAAVDVAIDLDPSNADAHYNRGATLINLDRFEEALAALNRAIHLEPDAVDAHLRRAYALNRLRRHEEARAAYDLVNELRSSSRTR